MYRTAARDLKRGDRIAYRGKEYTVAGVTDSKGGPAAVQVATMKQYPPTSRPRKFITLPADEKVMVLSVQG